MHKENKMIKELKYTILFCLFISLVVFVASENTNSIILACTAILYVKSIKEK